VLELEQENRDLRHQLAQVEARARAQVAEVERRHRADLVPVRQSVVLYEGKRRRTP
jgi:hypothetical protein